MPASGSRPAASDARAPPPISAPGSRPAAVKQ